MSDNEPDHPPKRPFQFGLATMLLIMLLFSVLAAAWAGMLHRSQGNSTMRPGFFVLMAIAAPMGLMILAGLFHAVVKYFKQRR